MPSRLTTKYEWKVFDLEMNMNTTNSNYRYIGKCVNCKWETIWSQKVKDGSRQKGCVKIGQKLSQRFFVKGWIISKLRENVKMQKVNCF